MPSPYIKQLARQTGKSEKELEDLWKQAKEITSETFGKPEKDFGDREYSYATGVVKQSLGLKEEIQDVSKFIKSDLDADQYIETVTSPQFTIGDVRPIQKKKKKKDEEEDEEDYEDFDPNMVEGLDQEIDKELGIKSKKKSLTKYFIPDSLK